MSVNSWQGLSNAVKEVVRREHYAVARWIYENGHGGEGSEADAMVICRAMDFRGTELAEFLTLSTDNLEKLTGYSLRDELVGPLLECCLDGECAARAVRGLSKIGRLDLMQQLRLPPTRVTWSNYWECALVNACERDDVPMLQWLMARTYWRGPDVSFLKMQARIAFVNAAGEGSVRNAEHFSALSQRKLEFSTYGQVDGLKNGRLYQYFEIPSPPRP